MASEIASSETPGLSVDNLNLTADEVSTYPRWYTDLLLRKRAQSITFGDIMAYVANFGLTPHNKTIICSLFPSFSTYVDPPIFYACLRLVSHAQSGQIPSYALIFQQAAIPKPKSIISKNKKQDPIDEPPAKLQAQPTGGSSNPFRRNTVAAPEPTEDKPKFDIDSFTSFMLTGSTPKPAASSTSSLGYIPPKASHNKRVMFDSNPPEVAEAAPRSMEELLRQARNMSRLIPTNTPPGASLPGVITGNYNVGGAFTANGSSNLPQRAPLVAQDTGDVAIDNHFKNINIDTVLHNGVSNLPKEPAINQPSFPFNFGSDSAAPSPQNTGPQQNPPPLPPKHSNGMANSFTGMSYQPMNNINNANPMSSTNSLPALQPTPTGPIQPSNSAMNSTQSLQLPNTASNPSMNSIPLPPQSRKPSVFISPQPTGPLQSQSTGTLNPQATGPLTAQLTGGSLNPQNTGPSFLQAQSTGSANSLQRGRSQSLNAPTFPNQTQQQQQQQPQMNSSVSSSNLFQTLQGQSTNQQNSNIPWNLSGQANSMTALPSQPTGAPPTLSDFKSIFHPPSSNTTPASSTNPATTTSSSTPSIFNTQKQPPNLSFPSYLGNNLNLPASNPSFNGSNSSLASQQSLQPQSTGFGAPAPPPSRRIFNGVEAPSPIGNSPSPVPTGMVGQQNNASNVNSFNTFNNINGMSSINNLNTMNNMNGIGQGGINNNFQRPQPTGDSAGPMMSNGLLMPPPPPASRRRVVSGSGEGMNGSPLGPLSANVTGSFGNNDFNNNNQPPTLHHSASHSNLLVGNQPMGFPQPQQLSQLQNQPQQFQHTSTPMANVQSLPMMNGVGNMNPMSSMQSFQTFQGSQQQKQQQQPQSNMYSNLPASSSVPNLVSGFQGMRLDGGMSMANMNSMNGGQAVGMNAAFGGGYMMNAPPQGQQQQQQQQQQYFPNR